MSSHPLNNSNALEFKILLAGEDGVGKTSLILRFIYDRFEESSNKSLDGDIVTKKFDLFGAPVKLQVQDSKSADWDEVVSYYITDNDGVLIVLDVTSKAKMKPYLDYWLKSIRDINAEIPVLVVGNKNDSSKKVNIPKTSQYVSKLGSNFIETSAKTGENVSYAFKLLTTEIVKQKAAAKKRSETRRDDGLAPIFSHYDL